MRTKTTAMSLLVRVRLSTWLRVLLSVLVVATAVGSAEAATFTVVSAADTDDPHPGDGRCGGFVRVDVVVQFYPCTLRAAITEINHLPTTPGTHHTINFNIPYGVQTICVGGIMGSSGCAHGNGLGLPTIVQPVVIDGTTQQSLVRRPVKPGTVSCVKVTGRPCIQLDGANAGSSDGLTLGAGNSTVSGLAIYNFGASGIHVMSDSNLINGNYIGTDHIGASAKPNGQHGVFVSGSASNNVIRSNLISGNSQSGVVIDATGFTDPTIPAWALRSYNQVIGNFIGTDATGTALVPNGMQGVVIHDASSNYIGSDAAGNVFGNVIAGSYCGVSISGDGVTPLVANNKVVGNYIGTNQAGAAGLASSGAGSPNLGNSHQGVNLCENAGGVIGTEVGGNFITNSSLGGIWNTTGWTGSSIHDNVALGNMKYDLDEDNPPPSCGNDTWANNTFKVAQGAGASCIH